MKQLPLFSKEEIYEKFKLEETECQRISNKINEIMLAGKEPEQNPVAIIDIAPPGSGKTGLNGMGVKQFKEGNVVVINSDELKPYHPFINQIAKYYTEDYTKITNQESNPWTDNLFEKAVKSKYNIIFEGTGRNLKLLNKMINKMKGYKIIVRGMAVNELNCLMSIVERYEGQVENKGWGRLVTLEHFYKAYAEMVDTIEQIENMGIVDDIEIYTRGVKPTEPIKIYSNKNKEFANSKLAIITGRKKDENNALKYYEERFKNNKIENGKLSAEKEILQKIGELYKNISKGNNER